MDAACVTNPISIGYLTGFLTEPHERVVALLATPERGSLLVPKLEFERARATVSDLDVAAYADEDDPWRDAAAAVGNGLGSLAIEKGHLSVLACERLLHFIGSVRLADAGEAILQWRAVKDQAELDALAKAAQLTDDVTERAFASIRVGQTELEVAARIDAEIAEVGGKPSFATAVQFGPDSALPHADPGARRLQPNELVLLDFGVDQRGYKADITRVAVAGGPEPRQRELHAAVLEAHDAAIERVRAGVTAGEVDRAAREVLQRAALGEAFIHRTGHGLGLEGHEAPSLAAGSDVVLEAGMVVTIEPGVYFPGWGGVRIEDDVVVEADGCRVLTRAARDLLSLPL